MPYNRPGAARSIAGIRSGSSRESRGVAAGLRYSEQGLSRGKRARSSNSTRAPPRASCSATDEPAGPPPTTTASQRKPRVIARSMGQQLPADSGDDRSDGAAREIDDVVVQPWHSAREPERRVTGPGVLADRVTDWAGVTPLQGRT